MSEVSVILTSYNRPTKIGPAIESVVSQSFKDWELLVIDDGSTQETRDVIEDWVKKDSRIKYFQTDVKEEDRQFLKGPCRYSVNINYCIKRASGKYITYLTDDDIFYNNHIKVLYYELEFNPNFMAAGSGTCYEILDDGGNTLEKRHVPVPRDIEQPVGLIDHNGFMNKKEMFDIIGYWPEDEGVWTAADGHLFNKMYANDIKILGVPKITHCHRIHKNSIQAKAGVIKNEVWSDL